MANFITRAVDNVVAKAGGDLTPGFNLPHIGGGSPVSQVGSGSYPQSAGVYDNGSGLTTLQNGVLGWTDTNASPVTNQTAAVDPYAQYGGTAKYNSLVSGFQNQRNTLNSSLTGAEQQAGRDYNQGVLGLLDQLRAGQTGIDRQSIQNELAKKQGTQGVLDMVGRGIQSGGVQLANRNAGTSSAAEALARAYGDIGRRQLSGVGNQYAQGQNAIANSQADLVTQQAGGVRDLGFSKEKLVNGLVQTAQTQLAALDAAMANASLPDRINIEQEKERVRQETLGQLSQFDQQLQQGIQGIAPIGADAARQQAQQLATAGVAPENAFDYTTQAPAQFQGTGPYASDLPIFTFPNGRKLTA